MLKLELSLNVTNDTPASTLTESSILYTDRQDGHNDGQTS